MHWLARLIKPTSKTRISTGKAGDNIHERKETSEDWKRPGTRNIADFRSVKEDLQRDTSYVRAAATVLYYMRVGPDEVLLLQRFDGWEYLANGRLSTDRTLVTDAVYVLLQLSANHTLQPIEEVFLWNYHLLSRLGSEARKVLDAVGLKVSLL